MLFEQLGQPWPKHRCEGFLKQLQPGQSQILEAERRRYLKGFQLDVELDQQSVARVGLRLDQAPPIVSVEPMADDALPIVGVVREVVGKPESLSRYRDLQQAAIAANDWRRIFSHPQVQVTVHCDEGNDSLSSYTFLADAAAVNKRIQIGDLVLAGITCKSLGTLRLWQAHQLDRLY